jgi:hypothetical protein
LYQLEIDAQRLLQVILTVEVGFAEGASLMRALKCSTPIEWE